MYDEEYMTRVQNPHRVVIYQSELFRMYFLIDQAKLFKLLVRVLYYIFSGYSKVGYLAADDWNKYYGHQYAVNVHQVAVCADS